jgi:lipopolysaccharide transport system permease protein
VASPIELGREARPQVGQQNAAVHPVTDELDVVGRRTLRTVIEPAALGRVNLARELARLPQFSDLLWTLTLHRIRVRYKQSRLGIAWAMLQPLAMMTVFTLMFSFIGRTPGGGVPYPLFAYAALLPWTAFSGGLSTATGSLTGHASLLTKVYFPREILPLTYVAAALLDLAIAGIALAALMLWYGVAPTATALWVIPLILVMTGFLISAGLLLSALQVRYRDVSLAMPVLLQVWLFASPILYPLTAVERTLPDPVFRLYLLNPMAAIADGFRRAVVLQRAPHLEALAIATAVTAVLLPLAYFFFKYTERTMADIV